jgi:hypothetical protein
VDSRSQTEIHAEILQTDVNHRVGDIKFCLPFRIEALGGSFESIGFCLLDGSFAVDCVYTPSHPFQGLLSNFNYPAAMKPGFRGA